MHLEPRPMDLESIRLKGFRLVVGLMSGTSADGVDAALVRIRGSGEATQAAVVAFETYPFSAPVRQRILSVCDRSAGAADEICRLNVLLGELFADATLKLVRGAGLEPADVDLIGSHGQTIRHLPEAETCEGHTVRATLQIGEPCVIAERTGILTVADFRARDVAAGGQGAPLVPLVDYLLFRSSAQARGMLNLGGIANITLLPAGCTRQDVVAFDVGPGNMILDHLIGLITAGRAHQDASGRVAASGRVHEPLLAKLMAHAFLRQEPPKSAGREEFGARFSESLFRRAHRLKISGQDLVATATAFTAHAAHDAVRRFAPGPVDLLVVSGGGVHNTCLMGHLKRLFGPVQVVLLEALGMSSDAKEAVAFAVLANETLFGLPGNLPRVTGASHPAVLGKIVPG